MTDKEARKIIRRTRGKIIQIHFEQVDNDPVEGRKKGETGFFYLKNTKHQKDFLIKLFKNKIHSVYIESYSTIIY